MQIKSVKDYRKFSKLFFKYLYVRIRETMILSVASALSYTTLIAVVPLLVIALSIFAAFPLYDDIRVQVQDFLIHYFVPDLGENIQNYIQEFIGASAKLTSFGVVGLAITALLLLSTIENSFNFIFKVKKHRRISTKITLYWTIITLCPLLLGAAFSLKGYLLTLKYFKPDYLLGYNAFTTIVLPNIFTFGVLLFSYITVPNKKIRFSSAFYGALVAFVLMLVLRLGFSYFLALNMTYKTLYGALAVIPVLLVWMYLWWTVVLFGAIITAASDDFRGRRVLWKKHNSALQKGENQLK